MIFHSYANKNHFHEKGCVLGLRTQQQDKVKKKKQGSAYFGGVKQGVLWEIVKWRI